MFNRGKKIQRIGMPHNTGFFESMPLFFKLWFAFCLMLMISIMVATIAVILNPQWIGEFVGEIMQGFNSVK